MRVYCFIPPESILAQTIPGQYDFAKSLQRCQRICIQLTCQLLAKSFRSFIFIDKRKSWDLIVLGSYELGPFWVG